MINKLLTISYYTIGFLSLCLVGLDLAQASDGVFSIVAWAFGIVSLFTVSVVIYKNQMSSYVLKRLLEAGFTVFVIATVTFLLLRYLPGGPFDSEKALPQVVLENLAKKYNMDQPLWQQYASYMGNLLQGDLGESYKYIGRGVSEIISEAFPASLKLGIYSLFLSFLIGIPLGVYAAANHNKFGDTFAMFLAMSGVAVPPFLVAPILIIIFSFWLNILPPALWDGPLYYILPVITLGVRPAGIIARLTRSSILDVIHSDFIRTAKSKGLAQRVVMYKHVLRNSLIPVVTMSGPLVANVLSGSFVIEIIFAVPGIGKHFVTSVTNRDYPLVLGLTLMYSVILIAANLIVDLLYAIIDPRIKLA